MLEVVLLWICSFFSRGDYLISAAMFATIHSQYDEESFHFKCNALSVIMASDKAKVAKKGAEDPGLPSASREGETSHEPQRQRSLNG